jgi:hypothetical protein
MPYAHFYDISWMASGYLLDRVEREFEQHLLPVYHPRDAVQFSKLVQAAKLASAKLHFDNLQDAGDRSAALVLFCSSRSSSITQLDGMRMAH